MKVIISNANIRSMSAPSKYEWIDSESWRFHYRLRRLQKLQRLHLMNEDPYKNLMNEDPYKNLMI